MKPLINKMVPVPKVCFVLLVEVDSVVAIGGLCGDVFESTELGLEHGFLLI